MDSQGILSPLIYRREDQAAAAEHRKGPELHRYSWTVVEAVEMGYRDLVPVVATHRPMVQILGLAEQAATAYSPATTGQLAAPRPL